MSIKRTTQAKLDNTKLENGNKEQDMTASCSLTKVLSETMCSSTPSLEIFFQNTGKDLFNGPGGHTVGSNVRFTCQPEESAASCDIVWAAVHRTHAHLCFLI